MMSDIYGSLPGYLVYSMRKIGILVQAFARYAGFKQIKKHTLISGTLMTYNSLIFRLSGFIQANCWENNEV